MLFTYQGTSKAGLCANRFGKACFHKNGFVQRHIVLSLERRRRDLNPRAAINDLHPFQGCPFDHLGTSPKSSIIKKPYAVKQENLSFSQRREWDSNPRALADKRFSRPPRYDHFDISPKCPASSAANVIIANMKVNVNLFFQKKSLKRMLAIAISSGVVTFMFV